MPLIRGFILGVIIFEMRLANTPDCFESACGGPLAGVTGIVGGVYNGNADGGCAGSVGFMILYPFNDGFLGGQPWTILHTLGPVRRRRSAALHDHPIQVYVHPPNPTLDFGRLDTGGGVGWLLVRPTLDGGGWPTGGTELGLA